MRSTLTIALMALVAVLGLSSCAETKVNKHPAVVRSELLPAIEGFSYDKDYAARSFPEARFYDYAYSANLVLLKSEAKRIIKRELNAKGWQWIADNDEVWESEQVLESRWRREIREDRWDTLKVIYRLEFDGKNIDESKSTIIYKMGDLK